MAYKKAYTPFFFFFFFLQERLILEPRLNVLMFYLQVEPETFLSSVLYFKKFMRT